MTYLIVNRYLQDKAMDRIDHALGRPLDPMSETYRNHYATDGALADEMASSPFWHESKRRPEDTMRFFHVTEAGCRALADHLRAIKDKHRAFVVKFDRWERVVVATTPAKARYQYFCDLIDSWPMSFKDYCRKVSVKVA